MSLGVAANLRDALTQARQRAYDLALVDVRLVEGDGFGVVSALRDLDPKLVSVMMSGRDVDVYRDDAFNAGARGILQKSEIVMRGRAALLSAYLESHA